MGRVGFEGDRVARLEVEELPHHVQPQDAGEHDHELLCAGRVGLGPVPRARREAQLVELDRGVRADGRERAALELAVERAEHLRVAATEDLRARPRLAEQLGERQAEAGRDLPQDAERRVRLAGLDLRERGAAHAARLREILERHAARLAPLPQVFGDPAPELRRAALVPQRRARRARVLRRPAFASGARRCLPLAMARLYHARGRGGQADAASRVGAASGADARHASRSARARAASAA